MARSVRCHLRVFLVSRMSIGAVYASRPKIGFTPYFLPARDAFTWDETFPCSVTAMADIPSSAARAKCLSGLPYPSAYEYVVW